MVLFFLIPAFLVFFCMTLSLKSRVNGLENENKQVSFFLHLSFFGGVDVRRKIQIDSDDKNQTVNSPCVFSLLEEEEERRRRKLRIFLGSLLIRM